MQISFIDISGNIYTITAEPGITLGAAKQLLKTQYNLQPNQFKFCRKQTILNDNVVFKEDTLKEGEKISLFSTLIFPQKTFPAVVDAFNIPQFPFEQFRDEIVPQLHHKLEMPRHFNDRYMFPLELEHMRSVLEDISPETQNVPRYIDQSYLYSGIDDYVSTEERQNRQANQNHPNDLDRQNYPMISFLDNNDPEMMDMFLRDRPMDQVRLGMFRDMPPPDNEPEPEEGVPAVQLSPEEEQIVQRMCRQYGLSRAEATYIFDISGRSEANAVNIINSL